MGAPVSLERVAAITLGGAFLVASVALTVGFAESRPERAPRRIARAEEPQASASVLELGEAVFEESCQACHGRRGRGGVGPALADGAVIEQFPDRADHAEIVRKGTGAGKPYGTTGKGTAGMPAWDRVLSEEEIEAVVSYERSL